MEGVYKGAATSIVKLYPFKQTLVWRVRAKDVSGNQSAWLNSNARKIVAYQNKNTTNVYRGAWHNVNSEASSGHGYAVTRPRATASRLTFTGRAVLYVAPKTSKSGYVKVYVDGKLSAASTRSALEAPRPDHRPQEPGRRTGSTSSGSSTTRAASRPTSTPSSS